MGKKNTLIRLILIILFIITNISEINSEGIYIYNNVIKNVTTLQKKYKNLKKIIKTPKLYHQIHM